MESRFLTGVIAGGIASLVKDALNLASYYLLRFSKTKYLDFAAVLIYGHKPRTIAENIFAQLAELGWSTALGVFFIYLVSAIGTRNYLLKSTFYSVVAWFSFYAVVVIHRVQGLSSFSLASAISNTLTSIIYGLVLGLVSRWLLRREIYSF